MKKNRALKMQKTMVTCPDASYRRGLIKRNKKLSNMDEGSTLKKEPKNKEPVVYTLSEIGNALREYCDAHRCHSYNPFDLGDNHKPGCSISDCDGRYILTVVNSRIYGRDRVRKEHIRVDYARHPERMGNFSFLERTIRTLRREKYLRE